VAEGVGLEEELEEDLVLGLGEAPAAVQHGGAVAAVGERRAAGVLLEAAAEVPGEPGLALLVGHDVGAAGEEAGVRLAPAGRRPLDPAPRVVHEPRAPGVVPGAVDREAGAVQPQRRRPGLFRRPPREDAPRRGIGCRAQEQDRDGKEAKTKPPAPHLSPTITRGSLCVLEDVYLHYQTTISTVAKINCSIIFVL
jgi:hypothetical protein